MQRASRGHLPVGARGGGAHGHTCARGVAFGPLGTRPRVADFRRTHGAPAGILAEPARVLGL